jgi:hypothetical protein
LKYLNRGSTHTLMRVLQPFQQESWRD